MFVCEFFSFLIIPCRREKIQLNPVKSRLCQVPSLGEDSPRIGYIKLTSFNQNASGKKNYLLLLKVLSVICSDQSFSYIDYEWNIFKYAWNLDIWAFGTYAASCLGF